MSEIYVVTEQKGRVGQMKNTYVTDDADEAKEYSDQRYKQLMDSYDTAETFIEVWDIEKNELQYVTREHPKNVK